MFTKSFQEYIQKRLTIDEISEIERSLLCDIEITLEDIDEAFDFLMRKYSKTELANWIIKIIPNSVIKKMLLEYREEEINA